ncbi:MAG: hypothetical protein Fur0022_23530 [Anaerolineales bacterium]
MSGPVELLVSAYNEQGKAENVLQQLRKAEKEGLIRIANAAILTKDSKGEVEIHETEDVDSKKGAIFGAITGGLLGLLGGPIGAVLGAAAGAATGGFAAKKIDFGFEDDALHELKEGLTPGSSAIIAIVEHAWVEKVIAALEKFEGKLFRRMLMGQIADQLAAEQEKTE